MPYLFAVGEPAVEPWLNYGAFGLLAALVLYAIWNTPKVIDKAFGFHKEVVTKITDDTKEANKLIADAHKTAIEKMVCSFENENAQCRLERIDTAKLFITEQEKNREAKHQLSVEFRDALSKITTAKSA